MIRLGHMHFSLEVFPDTNAEAERLVSSLEPKGVRCHIDRGDTAAQAADVLLHKQLPDNAEDVLRITLLVTGQHPDSEDFWALVETAVAASQALPTNRI